MRKGILAVMLVLFAASAFAGALTAARDTKSAVVNRVSVGVYTNTTIYQGGMIALNSSGYAVEASDAASIQVIGEAAYTVDNTTIAGTQSGASGAKNVIVNCGQAFYWDLSDAVAYSNKLSIGQLCYVADDHTVSVSGSGLSHNAIAGAVADWDSVAGKIAVVPPASAVTISGAGAFSSITVTNAATVGSLSDSGTLAVTGAATLSSTLAVTGATTLRGAASITNGTVTISNLPTSTNGLTSGRVWANSNVLTVFP